MTFDSDSRMRPLACCAVFLAALLFAGVAGAQDKKENVIKGKLLYSNHTVLLAPFGGVLADFDYTCGEKVEKGQVLGWVELEQADWYAIKGRLGKMWDMISKQPGRRKMVLEKERLIKKRKAEQELIDKGFSADDSVDEIDTEIELLRVALKEYDENIQSQKSDYAIELKLLKEKFKKKVVPSKLPKKAPVVAEESGYVVVVYPQVASGKKVGPGAALMTISTVDPMIVQAQVFEHDIVKLKVGDTATVRVEALDNREYEAVLTEISWTPVTRSFDQPSYYEVELEVQNSDLELKEGFEVQVIFIM